MASQPKETVSIITRRPQQLDPVKVIDTNKGGIIVKYPSSSGGKGGGKVIRIDSPTNEISSSTANAIVAQSPQAISRAEQEMGRSLASQNAKIESEAQQRDNNFSFKISPQGRVTVGNRSYLGEAIIPGTNMTANQFSRDARNQTVASGDLDVRNFGRASFTGSFTSAVVGDVIEPAPMFSGDTGEAPTGKNALVIKDYPGFVISDKPAYRSVGVPFGTEQEALEAKSNPKFPGSLYGISSKGLAVFDEVYFANQITGYQNVLKYGTTGTFTANQEMIGLAKSAYNLNMNLDLQNLSESEFNTQFNMALPGLRESARLDAKSSFNALPYATRNKLDQGDIIVGLGKVGVGIKTLPIDFFSNAGVQGVSTNRTFADAFKYNTMQYDPGTFEGSLQTANIGTPGKIAIGLTTVASLGLGFEAGLGVYRAERLAGASRRSAFDTVLGEGVASFSPIQFSRIQGVRVTRTREVPITFDNPQVPFKTLKVGSLTGRSGTTGDLFTSQGESRTVSTTNVEFTSIKPKFFGDFEIERKSFSFPTAQQVTLRPNNIANVKLSGQDSFGFSARGERRVDILSRDIIQTDRYNLGTSLRIDRRIEGFEGFGTGRIISKGDTGLNFGISKSQFRFKPLQSTTFSGDTFTLTGKGAGRPVISRSNDFFGETAKISDNFGTKIFGKARSFTFGQGRKGKLGFVTNTYIPNSDISTFKIGSRNTISGGFPKSSFNGLSSTQTSQSLQTIGSTSLKGSLAPRAIRNPAFTFPKTSTANNFYQLGAITSTQSTRQTQSLRSSFLPRSALISRTSSLNISSVGLATAQRSQQASITSQLSSPLFANPSPLAPSLSQGPGLRLSNPFLSGPVFSGFGFPSSLGGDIVPTRRRKGRKAGFNIAPSFTGITLGLTMKNPIGVNRTFGLSGFESRGILVGKKRKGPYFKLTGL